MLKILDEKVLRTDDEIEDSLKQFIAERSRLQNSPLCVIFAPNSGYIVRYALFIWRKSPTNCDAHLVLHPARN